MTPVYLFNVVSQSNRWLAARQATIASNVANVNTPGYKAQDVQPFEMAVEQARLAMATTQRGHVGSAEGAAPTPGVRPEQPWDVTHTGNSVSLEQELIKAGDVKRAYRLNNRIDNSFHRIILASVKV
jgi:flagellar basal-body rod protein FlgB